MKATLITPGARLSHKTRHAERDLKRAGFEVKIMQADSLKAAVALSVDAHFKGLKADGKRS